MRYRPLGRTGITVSEVGFGGWGIGGRTVGDTSYGDTDDGTSLAALGRALDRGITFFDTASAYGNGHSESLIGQAFERSRHQVVIATKAGYESWDRPADFTAAAILRSAEASLKRLRTDYLDLLQFHNPPLDVLNSDEVRDVMVTLQQAGKIRSWGVSVKSPADALTVLAVSAPAAIQVNLNMMDVRAVTSGLLDEAMRREVGIIGRTPLCFGFLTGTIVRGTEFPPGDHRHGWSRAQLENWIDGAAELLAAVSASPGPEGVTSAVRFCLSFQPVSSIIPGLLTPREVDENAAASDHGALAAADVAAILEINRRRSFFVERPRTP